MTSSDFKSPMSNAAHPLAARIAGQMAAPALTTRFYRLPTRARLRRAVSLP